MSGFLYRLPTTITPLARSTVTRQAPRAFSISLTQRENTVTDAVKQPLKKVDRVVSDTLVKGIDVGVEAKNKAASVAGVKADEAKGKASEVAGEAKGKSAELKGEAKGKAEEVKGKI